MGAIKFKVPELAVVSLVCRVRGAHKLESLVALSINGSCFLSVADEGNDRRE